jgi:high-affinity nickel-transport protein
VLTLFSLMAVGFFLGMRHATDADHVVAVATIVSREKSLGPAAAIGALWGVGHGVTVAAVGSLIILFGLVIPPRVGLATEFAVGGMLAVLGVFTLASVWRQGRETEALEAAGPADGATHYHPLPPVHSHVHRHGDYVHSHPHGHGTSGHGHGPTAQDRLDLRFGRLGWYRALRPVVVGVVHGLAGSAAVALLVLGTVPDARWGFAYLLVFGLGTIAGMMAVTAAIALPFVAGAGRAPRFSAGLRLASGLLSLGFGFFLMYQIGVVDGLFSANPQWDPH